MADIVRLTDPEHLSVVRVAPLLKPWIARALLIVVGGIPAAGGTPQGGPAPDGDLAVATSRVRQLQKELEHQPSPCLDEPCIQTKVAAVRTILREYTVEALNRTGGDTSRLSADLRFIAPAIEYGPEGLGHVFRRQGAGGDHIVTFSVVYCGGLAIMSHAVIIQGFRKEGPRYVFASETKDTLWGVGINKVVLLEQSSRSDELWIMADGRIIGSSRNRGGVRIYGFDGYRFEEMWKPPLREDLDLKVRRDEIDVYYRERRPTVSGFDDMDLIHEVLQLTESGVIEGARVNLGPIEDPKVAAKF